MEKIKLFHGSFNESVTPVYGLGEEKHDYGKGFYLTENIELAKEWAVCRPNITSGWVHQYELEINELSGEKYLCVVSRIDETQSCC